MNVNFKLETVIHGEYSMLPGLLTWELITVFQMMMMVSKKGQRRGRETTGRGIKGGRGSEGCRYTYPSSIMHFVLYLAPNCRAARPVPVFMPLVRGDRGAACFNGLPVGSQPLLLLL